MTQRTLYKLMGAGGLIGAAAAFLQTLEKIQLLTHKDDLLVCDLNRVFSCTTVLKSRQSAVFGFPNSLMCMALFIIFASMAAVGASGGTLPRQLRLTIHGLSVATLIFAIWFLTQSIYAIGALCILCIFCFAGLLLVNWAWLRLNAAVLPIGARGRRLVARAIAKDFDILLWILLASALAVTIIIKFF